MRKIFTLMLSLLALCLPAAAQTAQPDVTLTFRKTGTGTTAISSNDFFSKVLAEDCASYVSAGAITGVYPCNNATDAAIKIGANSGSGTITFTLAADYQKTYSKIVIKTKRFNAKGSPTVTVNNKTSSDELATSTSEYSEMTFAEFGDEYADISITNGKTGAILLESVAIYFKPEVVLDPVAQPVITCSDNMVTISCGTEGASIVYSTDGTEPSIPYTGAFSITETCTVKAKASKEGMADNTAEKLCEYVAPAVKPSKPVVTIDGEVQAEEGFAVDYGKKITVSSENATSMVVAYGSEEVPVEGNTYEFEATANETYMVTPVNDKMPEGKKEGEAAMFTVAINAPEIVSVMNGDVAIEEFGSIVAKVGTEITVTAKSYAEIAVENEGLAVTVTDGKFVIGNEKSYIITVSNPACEAKAEMMFSVTHPVETEYEANETLNWDITGVASGNAATSNCDTKLNLGTGSANGDWTAAATACYSGSNNGAQLGSGAKAFVDGTITLSGSDIPENATITAVSMKGISGNTLMEWTLSVNGVEADTKLSFPSEGTSYGKEKHSIKTISDLSLAGNNIVLTMTSAGDKKAFYMSGISVSYQVLAEAAAPEFEKPQTISDGTEIVYTVKHGKLHYKIEDAGAAKSPMMRVSEPTADWTVAWEDAGKKFVYTYASGNNHNIYVKNVVNGKAVEGEAINVKEGVLTGVEAVAAEGAEGVRELYNLQGVRVSEAEAVPGVYVERRGGKVAKVVIR